MNELKLIGNSLLQKKEKKKKEGGQLACLLAFTV